MKSAVGSRRVGNRQQPPKRDRAGNTGQRARSAPEHSYTATQAKNEFGTLLDQAGHGATVVITKHDSPRAVLISMEQFNALRRAPEVKLNTLSAEFDLLLERMQTRKARSAMKAAFEASPAQLGKAAVAAARRRG